MMFLAAALATAACLPVTSDRITAADVAAAVPAFNAVAPDVVLSYAPVPGNSRVFLAAELKQRVPDAQDVPDSLCFEWPMREPSEDELRAAMVAALPEGSEVALNGSAQKIPEGTLQFTIAGLTGNVWRGRVQYAPGRHFDFRVGVAVTSPRVVATEQIRAGERIDTAKLKIETGAPVNGQASALSQVEGRVARRFFPAGSAITLIGLGSAKAVSRGDAVQVRVVSGGAQVRFDGVAQSAAAQGEIVAVRNTDSGRVIHARVTNPGLAVLELAGSPVKEKE